MVVQKLVAGGGRVAPSLLRHLSTTRVAARGETSPGQVHPGYIKIREQYKRFQVEDGVPVHLKAGGRDKLLFGVTLALTLCGLAGCVEYFYSAAYPPKSQ